MTYPLSDFLNDNVLTIVASYLSRPEAAEELGASNLKGFSLQALFSAYSAEPSLRRFVELSITAYPSPRDLIQRINCLRQLLLLDATREFPGVNDLVDPEDSLDPTRLAQIAKDVEQSIKAKDLITVFTKLVEHMPEGQQFLASLEGDVFSKAQAISQWMHLHPDLLTQDSLDISNLGLRSLPQEIGLLTQLTNLRATDNFIREIPESLGSCIQLTSIRFTNNKLRKLPACFTSLTNLTGCNISGNQLTRLPDNFGNLTHLEYFLCNNNQLESLPNSIGGCVALISLEASNNQLRALPPTFGNLANLRSCFLYGNHLTAADVPAHLIDVIRLQAPL